MICHFISGRIHVYPCIVLRGFGGNRDRSRAFFLSTLVVEVGLQTLVCQMKAEEGVIRVEKLFQWNAPSEKPHFDLHHFFVYIIYINIPT